jgi:hypothetical protein
MVSESNRRIIYPRQRTDVIFMAMCYNNCFDFVAPFLDECCVRDNLLHTKLVVADKISNKSHLSKSSACVNRKRLKMKV